MLARTALAVGALALVLSGCGGDDDEGSPATTRVTVTLGEDLAVGDSYQDPSGDVTLTVQAVRTRGRSFLADAEACSADDAPPGIPIQPSAWQLQVDGRDELLPRSDRPPPGDADERWPETLALDPGQCFEGTLAFDLPRGAQPSTLLFTQLNPPVSWRVDG